MTPRASARPALPAADVLFPADFTRRLERLVVRLCAGREIREGAGRSGMTGGGEEFVGYRPYRPGEDLRGLDWNLYARLDRAYVRVTRREAAERFWIALDGSASMGVGPPGKLSAGAQVAAALACTGLRIGARVDLICSHSFGVEAMALDGQGDRGLQRLLAFLETRRAGGDVGLAELVAKHRPPADAGRVFLIGDLLDLAGDAALALASRRRDVALVQLLAPHELTPPAGGVTLWLDPEGDGQRMARLDARSLATYERRLEEKLEAWRELAARHGFGYGCFASDTPFEDVVRALLERRL